MNQPCFNASDLIKKQQTHEDGHLTVIAFHLLQDEGSYNEENIHLITKVNECIFKNMNLKSNSHL